MRSLHHVSIIALVVLATAFIASPAAAEEHGGENIFGLRVLGGSAFAHEHTAGVVGAGVTAEHAFFHHALELEAVGTWVRHGEEDGVNGELVLKIPLAHLPSVDFFAGAGGVVSFAQHTTGGFLFDLGGRAWTGEHWGVGMEVDYLHFLGEHGSDAVEGAVDVMYRF